MKREVEPITKESQLYPGERVPCPCGCGSEGVPKKRANKDGLNHIRNCPCRPCIGFRNRAKGRDSQSKARRSLGIPSSRYRGKDAHEENWRDPLHIWEHKNDKVNAKPVVGAFRRMEAQALASKAIGDPRPFAASVEWDGEELVIQRKRDYRAQREAS